MATYQTTLAVPLSWINDPTNPAVYVTSGTAGGASGAKVLNEFQSGEFRGYANGRVRVVTTPYIARQVQVTMRNLTLAQETQLRLWAGTLLLYRDWTGFRMFGTYLTPSSAALPGISPLTYDVTMAWTEASYTEAAA